MRTKTSKKAKTEISTHSNEPETGPRITKCDNRKRQLPSDISFKQMQDALTGLYDD